MPTYAYACTECDHRFEVVQSFDDDTLTVCPECGGRLRKVFNAVGIVFKGGGFYRTDSRSSGNGGAGARSGAATSGSSESSGSSTSGDPAAGSSSSSKDAAAGSSSSSGSSSTPSSAPAASSTPSG